ncbi:hypothetical protein [Flavobacterium microcysteis]
MEKQNKILLWFFIAVVILSLAGFFNTYIRFFPNLDKFPFIIHIHFLAFVSWFALIVIQPILIRQKNTQLHRKIGKISYFIAPILVITILMLVKNQAQRELPISENDAAIKTFMGLLDAVSFSVYYIIAMINRRNLRWHVAFLMAATLVVFNPGMSRLLNQMQFGLGLWAAVVLPFIVSIGIIVFEKIKLKKPILKSPYFLFFCCWTIEIALFITIPNTEFWRNFVVSTMK